MTTSAMDEYRRQLSHVSRVIDDAAIVAEEHGGYGLVCPERIMGASGYLVDVDAVWCVWDDYPLRVLDEPRRVPIVKATGDGPGQGQFVVATLTGLKRKRTLASVMVRMRHPALGKLGLPVDRRQRKVSKKDLFVRANYEEPVLDPRKVRVMTGAVGDMKGVEHTLIQRDAEARLRVCYPAYGIDNRGLVWRVRHSTTAFDPNEVAYELAPLAPPEYWQRIAVVSEAYIPPGQLHRGIYYRLTDVTGKRRSVRMFNLMSCYFGIREAANALAWLNRIAITARLDDPEPAPPMAPKESKLLADAAEEIRKWEQKQVEAAKRLREKREQAEKAAVGLPVRRVRYQQRLEAQGVPASPPDAPDDEQEPLTENDST